MIVGDSNTSDLSKPTTFYCSVYFRWFLVLFAFLFTLAIYLAEFFDVQHPLKGHLELVLGLAELFGWLFIYGDDANRLNLITVGLPFAMIGNCAAFWLIGRSIKCLCCRE